MSINTDRYFTPMDNTYSLSNIFYDTKHSTQTPPRDRLDRLIVGVHNQIEKTTKPLHKNTLYVVLGYLHCREENVSISPEERFEMIKLIQELRKELFSSNNSKPKFAEKELLGLMRSTLEYILDHNTSNSNYKLIEYKK